MKEGFFTRQEARGPLPGKKAAGPGTERTAEQLHRLGLRGVEGMNPEAKHPNIQPTGDPHPDLYVLGEAPGEQEDRQGEPFVGPSGRLLRQALGTSCSLRFDNVCRTRPPGNRPPKWEELECFRPSVVASIEEANPKALLLVGNHALTWAFPGLPGGIRVARGRRFLCRVGRWKGWAYPILHPAYVLRLKGSREREGEVPAEELVKVWDRDLALIPQEVAVLPEARPVTLRTLERNTRLLTDPGLILAEPSRWCGRKFAIDLETSHKRPYADGARILTVALSDWRETVAFPIGHPEAGLSDLQQRTILGRLAEAMAGTHVVAHNLSFDLEWLIFFLGVEAAHLATWHDTMAQAFLLDERIGALGLDYLSRQHLGIALKGLSDLDRAALASQPLDRVLRYNALDAKSTYGLHRIQWPRLKSEDLLGIYAHHIRRIPALVLAQREGLRIDVQVVRSLAKTYDAEMRSIESKVRKVEAVRAYERRYGPFKLSSNRAVTVLFRDLLGRKEGKRPNNRYSTDRTMLEAIQSEEPVAGMLLEYRRAMKLRGTYIERFLPEAPNSYVYPDGRIHCIFNSTLTGTGRTSSQDPNNQNWPKRRDKEVRRMVVAPKGWVLLASDYKQLEAWTIACVSRDRRFCDALLENLDVHQHWADKIAAEWPKALKAAGGPKKFRSIVKNQWVFPQFFGSSYRSCARNLGLPEELAEGLALEFWEEFEGVRKWQKEVVRFYERHHYIEGATGRRRHAPLSYNQVINTPIQGPASDVVIDSMCRLSERAQEAKIPWLQPVLNIHDDLTFVIPRSDLDLATEIIPQEMTKLVFDWAILPLTVELEAGPNWYDMEPLGSFTGPRGRYR